MTSQPFDSTLTNYIRLHTYTPLHTRQASHRPDLQPTSGAAHIPGYLPAYSAMLGTCGDGLPFVLDLQDPTAGSILVTGDMGCGKTNLLKNIVTSTTELNSPREVQYVLLTQHPEEWAELTERHTVTGHCRLVASCADSGASRLVLELSALAEQRRDGDGSGLAILLVVDDFTPFLSADYDVQVNLHWLIHQGPLSRIWPIFALNADWALDLPYWVDLFRTRLLGKMRSKTTAQRLALHPNPQVHSLEAGAQFKAWLNQRWMDFYVPRA